jgi:hypothetical protein
MEKDKQARAPASWRLERQNQTLLAVIGGMLGMAGGAGGAYWAVTHYYQSLPPSGGSFAPLKDAFLDLIYWGGLAALAGMILGGYIGATMGRRSDEQ